ncbi:arsenate reductase (glutaredoxin) [Faecalibacter sp. LW9]|uniref:arsenate reductase (glutaredoxin) n=1 Tax=Faecalibacter sp. LW9 TaxID=3103144 RepID=UPI002AFF393D|nr:arsenate reductase (glutaredoxin) [Faecalibacter sp. LW9]
MYTILHNSRCGKSRDAVNYLEEQGVEFQVREYLKDELSFEELKSILDALQIAPIELIRTNESIWKEQFKGKDWSDDELIKIMIKHPKLIQRPIVLKDNQGVVGRPLELIQEFIKK